MNKLVKPSYISIRNILIVSNFAFKQEVNYTFFKGNNRSYIDHILIPKHLLNKVSSCKILNDDVDNTSDHFALKMTMHFNISKSKSSQSCELKPVNNFPKPLWKDENFIENNNCTLHSSFLAGKSFSSLSRKKTTGDV